MVDITESRTNIQEKEASFRASVSEALAFRLGQSVNFINKRHFETQLFCLNGSYTAVAQNGVDGLFVAPFDMDILYVSMSNVGAGSAGTTEVDLKKITSPGGSSTSIFSTTPKINSSATSNTWILKDILTPVNDVNPTGTTLPVFIASGNELDQGQALSFDIISSMSGASDLALRIYYRPR